MPRKKGAAVACPSYRAASLYLVVVVTKAELAAATDGPKWGAVAIKHSPGHIEFLEPRTQQKSPHLLTAAWQNRANAIR